MQNNSIIVVKKGFEKSYRQLKLEQVKVFRADCRKRLGWSESTINNKRTGRTEVTVLEKPVLKSIFRKFSIELI